MQCLVCLVTVLRHGFALVFELQVIIYDNATTSTSMVPSGDPLACGEVSGADGTDAAAMLKAMDGHLWTSESDGMQCARVKAAIEALDSGQNAVLVKLATWASAGGLLPTEIRSAVCDPLTSMTTYLSKLSDSASKLTLSGDNTASITSAQTSSDTLMKNVGCKE